MTGTEGQLGRVYVSHLLELGYDVIGFDTPKKPHQKMTQYFSVDVTDLKKMKKILDKIFHVDILINNAGVAVFTPFEDRTPEELDLVMDVNIKAMVLLTQQVFTRFFKPKKHGCIVNVGSIYGVVAGDMRIYKDEGRRTSEIYGAAKAAVIHLTKYFAAYMAPHNVRVNCVSPGGVFYNHPPEFVAAYSKKVPMNRMANQEELVSTIEYLISEKSSYLTGQNIVVDGGFSAW